MGHVRGDIKDGGGNARRIPPEDNGEECTDNHKWDVGDTGRRRGVEGGWDVDIRYIHQVQSGDSSAEGGSTSDI